LKFQHGTSAPKPGDIATISEIYTEPAMGVELVCCGENGMTRWLETFERSEIRIEKLGA
jgi:hypothetical protein